MAAEVYVSTDVETDGPIPGPHSMLSFASAAFLGDGTQVGTFSANLATLEGARGHPKTMEWWKRQPEAWAACRTSVEEPAEVMPRYVKWLKSLPGQAVFVAYPVGFDFMFVYWYLMRFAGESPFSFSALDIKTYAMAMMKCPYRSATKKRMPAEWFAAEVKHSHVALDDAIEQGLLFCNMLKAHTSDGGASG